jgi:predicted HicB family RNase H-like nuclease
MITLPTSQSNTKAISITIPKEVHAAARVLVNKAKISLSIYITTLVRADLAARRRNASSPTQVPSK